MKEKREPQLDAAPSSQPPSNSAPETWDEGKDMTAFQWREELARAHSAQLEAELLLDSKTESLWRANKQLQEFAVGLEQRINERTNELRRARDQALAAEHDLKAAKDAADEANRAKSDFLANMSHEIRTPLAAIVGYADLLSGIEFEDKQHDAWIGHLRLNAEHLMTLIGDVLDLSKIEAGRLEMDLQPVYLAEELMHVVAMLEPQVLEKGLHFELKASGELPPVITTDTIRLRQILLNLGSNAVKFTQEGRIWIEAELTDHVPPRLLLSVGDTGDGISREYLEEIFRPFHQIAPNSKNGRAGTGLGLDISRKLTRGLGGQLSVQSQLGVGSVFRVTLPLTNTELERREKLRPQRPAGRQIPSAPVVSDELNQLEVIIVDDGPDNRRILTLMLERSGALVRSFSSGEDLLAHLSGEVAAVRIPGTILMDLQMPGIDGFETTRALRKRGVQTPIIATSVDASPETRERARQAGVDDYLSKPVLQRDLVSKILQLRRRGRGATRTPPPMSRKADDNALPDWIVAQYVVSLREHLQALTAVEARGDTRSQRLISHRLAGSGTSYGFPRITACAKAFERVLDAGAAPTAVNAALSDLVAALEDASAHTS